MNLIECQNLRIGYLDQKIKPVINLTIEDKDFVCLIGNNGTGKSTLVKTILKLLPLKGGKINYHQTIKKTSIGYLPQDLQVNADFPATVYEIVLSGCISKMRYRLFYGKKEKEIANCYLEKLDISHLKNKPFQELSGGEQQRTLIARALCSTEKIIFLDEPLQGLDTTGSKKLYEILSNINKELGVTIVMITHNVNIALNYVNKIVYLDKDDIFVGTPKEYQQTVFSKKNLGGHDHA